MGTAKKEVKRNMVVVRKKPRQLDDAERYKILTSYAAGVSLPDISKELECPEETVKKLISTTLNGMNTVRETNRLAQGAPKAIARSYGHKPTKFLTEAFIAALDEKAEVYAYYYAQTGDNKFALIQSGLDCGIARNVAKITKDYVYRIRGQYLRDMPHVKRIIQEEQDKRIREYHIEKPQVQMELVNQIEQLKEIVSTDPRQRNNLLKAIELLGRSLGAFTDRVEYEETDAKSGLQILMERAKGEAANVYEKKEE